MWEAGQHRYGAGRGGIEGEGAVSRGVGGGVDVMNALLWAKSLSMPGFWELLIRHPIPYYCHEDNQEVSCLQLTS